MTKMKNENRASIINGAIISVLFVGFVAYLIIRFSGCSKNQPNITYQKETQNLEIKRRIIPRAHRIQQSKAEIPKAQLKAQTIYDTIIVYIPDTCKPYLSSYKAYRDSTEQLILYVVASQDSTIRDQDKIIRNDSTIHERDKRALQDTVKYWRRWGIRRGRKGFGIGFVTGYGLREGINVINKLKK